jgi:hypothetical protein
MASFDDLPADQKAVLQLVLRQGRSYDEIAGLLKISPAAVRERALTALDAIGPSDGGDLSAAEQDDIGDYLLGQQGAAARAASRDLLERSAAGRAWARGVATELRAGGVAGEDSLPEVPADEAEIEEAFGALEARHRARAEQERSSRLGGVLLLIALGLALAAVVVLGINQLTKDDNKDKGGAAATATQTTSTTSGAAVTEAQINLTPPGGGTKPLGVATIVAQDGKRAIAVAGQDLPASGHYVLWLRNGSTSKFMGFFPPVTGKGSAKGKLQGLVEAPSDLASYNEMLVTREASDSPKQPTTIVLQGTIKR